MAGNVKVIYGKERLRIPLGPGADKVRVFVQRITMRFRAHTGKSAEDLKIVQLTTADDFLIDLDDNVQDAITPGEILVAVDEKQWLTQQEKLLTKPWLSVERLDFAIDKTTHILNIGLHEFGHLYMTYLKAKQGPVQHLEIIPTSRLLNFDKEGLFDIFTVESDDKNLFWQASAKFAVKQVGSSFIANSIVLSLKAASDPQPEIVVVALKSEGKGLAMESNTVRQKALQYLPPSKLTFPPLKEDVVVGTPFPDVVGGCAVKGFEGNSSLVSEATSSLKLEQIEPVLIEETHRESNGTFYNHFHIPLRMTNTVVGEARTIVKVESTYFDKNGVEQEASWTRFGRKRGYYDFSYQEPPYNIGVGTSDLICIRSSIKVTSQQLRNHRRIHPQLPRPIQIILRVTDDKGKVATLKVDVGEEPIKLKTQASLEEEGKKVLWFLNVDHPETEERVWAAAYLEKDRDDNILRIQHFENQSITYRELSLFRVGFEGSKNGQNEYKIDFKVDQKGIFTCDFWMLVDPIKKLPYAIRTQLKAGPSSIVAERLLPDFTTEFPAPKK